MNRYLRYFIILFLIAVGVAFLSRYTIKSNTPTFLLNKFEELKSNQSLMDSIGGFRSFEYSYNKNDFRSGDTVKYQIKIIGQIKVLVYEGVQARNADRWNLVRENLIVD